GAGGRVGLPGQPPAGPPGAADGDPPVHGRGLARPLVPAAAMIAVPEAAPRGITSEEEFPNGSLNRGRHPAGLVAATAATEGADAAWGKCSKSPPIRSRRPWQEPSPP